VWASLPQPGGDVDQPQLMCDCANMPSSIKPEIHNAARGEPSHGHRYHVQTKNLVKVGRVVPKVYDHRLTNTHRHARHNIPLSYRGRSKKQQNKVQLYNISQKDMLFFLSVRFSWRRVLGRQQSNGVITGDQWRFHVRAGGGAQAPPNRGKAPKFSRPSNCGYAPNLAVLLTNN